MSERENPPAERDEQYEQRIRKMEELRAKGIEPYANDFPADTSIAQFVESVRRQRKRR